MTGQIKQAGSFHASGRGLQVIASIQVVAAISLAIGLIVEIGDLWDPRAPLSSFLQILGLGVLVFLLLIMGWGLWKRHAWARLLTLIVYWASLVGGILLLISVLANRLINPPQGDGAGFVDLSLWFGLLFLSPVLLVSAWTLWYLHWRTVR